MMEDDYVFASGIKGRKYCREKIPNDQISSVSASEVFNDKGRELNDSDYF